MRRIRRNRHMRIIKSRVVLDAEYRNVLVKEYSRNYPGMDKLSGPGEIAQVMDEVFGLTDQAEEYVYLLAMTAKCRPISFFEVSHGTCSTCVVMPREVMVRALLCGAVNIVIIHNHPSGSPQPSQEDRQVTERIREASGMIGIHLCDHIIVARDGFFSFREAGLLDGQGKP